MSKKILLLLLTLSLAAPGVSALVLDVKTHVNEKSVLSAVKIGAIYYLLQSGYKILDIGEDYAVWLTDFSQIQKTDTIICELTVKICPTAGIKEKPALISRRISFNCPLTAVDQSADKEAVTVYLRKKLETKSDLAMAQGRLGGLVTAKTIMELLEILARQSK